MHISAYRGEFGLKVMHHAPWAYAQGAGHTVEIEAGDEALYPLAKRWLVVSRAPDATRTARPRVGPQRAYFRPVPYLSIGVSADVVICPRRRTYGESKNWNHWRTVAERLRAAGLRVFSGGVADASDLSVPGDAAWYYERPLDATLEAMQSAQLVVGSCGGLPILAVLAACPLLLFTYRGMVAPGPVINSRGKFVQKDYWPVRLQEYYAKVNHAGSPITVIDGWEYPERVAQKVIEACA